jgi:hypothetical protein
MSQEDKWSAFQQLKWDVNPQGNYTIDCGGKPLTILRSMLCSPEYGLDYDGQYIAHYHGQRIHDIETAKRAAFELFEQLGLL